MPKSRRNAVRPVVESMESRALLSVTPARAAAVSVLNPGIVAGSPGEPGVITSETPRSIQIVVLSQAGVHPFTPATSLVAGTVRVDGLAFRGVTIQTLPDTNGDGIPDAVITVPTRGLKLPAGGGIVTVSGTVRSAPGHPVVWTSATTVQVESNRLGSGITFVQGYINIINDTGSTVYEQFVTNTPTGGSPLVQPPNVVNTPLAPLQQQVAYTGPGTASQLYMLANFSRTTYGVNAYPVEWYAGAMTVSSFYPSNPRHWYLLLNQSGQIIISPNL